MVVMEDVTEEESSAELYVSVHGGLDHTFSCFEQTAKNEILFHFD